MEKKLEIIYIDIEDIKPYEKNPRIHSSGQIEKLKKIIKTLKIRKPIEVDENNIILCGHARYTAFKQLKIKKIPCIIHSDLSEQEKKTYRIIDNQISDESIWDKNILSEEIMTVPNFDFDFNFDFEVDEKSQKIELKPLKKHFFLIACDISDAFEVKEKVDAIKIENKNIEIEECSN